MIGKFLFFSFCVINTSFYFLHVAYHNLSTPPPPPNCKPAALNLRVYTFSGEFPLISGAHMLSAAQMGPKAYKLKYKALLQFLIMV